VTAVCDGNVTEGTAVTRCQLITVNLMRKELYSFSR